MSETWMLAALAFGGDYSATVTHPYLPFSTVSRTELKRSGPKKVTVVRRVEDKTEAVAGVDCLVLVEEEYVDGVVHEISRNFFAQKDGAVWFFGEDVDNYKAGKIDNHGGSWRVGKETKDPFLFMPALPKKGDTFKPEDVKGVAEDVAEVLSTSEAIEVGGAKYVDVLKVKYTILLDKEVKVRYYARGVGLVREEEGETLLDLQKAVPKGS